MTTLRETATHRDLLNTPLEDLASQAFAKARAANGYVVTYSPKVFIPLTKLCRDRCGYCTFAQAPAHVEAPYMSLDEVMAVAQAGRDAGCTEALFTLGERPELRYDEAARWLAARGYQSTVDYVANAAQMVLESTGLLPHANAGALYRNELAQLRTVAASQGMMIESLADLAAHRLAPDKDPQRRLDTLRFAGELRIPFTTGLLVGIGETREERLATLEAIATSHEEFGHVQEVIIQNFLPKARTAMAKAPAASDEEFHWTIAVARLLLPDSVHLQAPPNLSDDPTRLLAFGIDDFGGISPVTADHVNPERAWPALAALASECDNRGFNLEPRLTVYPEFIEGDRGFLDTKVRPFVLSHADSAFLARNDTWASGSDEMPPPPPTSRARTTAVSSLLARYVPGYDFDREELTTLFNARGADFNAVVDLADNLRQDLVGDDVTFVINRNINYTNVCTFKCRFCAFSKGPLSLNLRGDPYLLTLDEISERVREAEAKGATEVCLQGGIHPKFDGDYYIDVVAAVRAGSPKIHIHAFSALEVFEGARRSEVDLVTYLTRLKDAGLKTLPGTAAEILDDEIRKELCPDKINSQQWLDVHRAAHSVGLRSNITIMFGAVEGVDAWATHFLRTRDLQKETGGFTEFVPLAFVHMATPIFLKGRARRGPTFREAVLMHSVARLHYATLIDNIQVSWVKMGIDGSRRILQAGANDVGGTLMDENISRAAGATHGQEMDVDTLEALVEPIGRPLVQRQHPVPDVVAVDELIEAFLGDLQRESPLSPERIDVLRNLLIHFVELATVDGDIGDLRVAVNALDELVEASAMFSAWRDVPKLAIFGSARTNIDATLYEMARQLGAEMAQRNWMIVSGAGPGIMEASAKGAGRGHTLGVNIELPFEQFANPYIDAETMLVAMQYFFTRKVAMTRPSNAFAIFPGGLGTMDEAFEVLTLLHTGKTSPAPVVLVDAPDGTFWSEWLSFVERAIIAGNYIDAHDMCLVRICSSIDDAVTEIEHFFSNYESFEVRGDRAYIKVKRAPTSDQLAELTAIVPRFAVGAGYVLEDERTISFGFDGRNYVNLRLVIDRLNDWA